MRKTLLFLLCWGMNIAFAQFRDDFSDGDFTKNPVWLGNTAAFVVSADGWLKTSKSTVSQTVALRAANGIALNAKWEFKIQLNFDPSATNLLRVYLIADQPDLNGPLNGYFIQIGESGTADSYDLYRQTGSGVTKIIDGSPKNRANPNFLSTKLRVTRDDSGNWELYSQTDNESSFVLEGKSADRTHLASRWFGVYCKYTATRSDGFAFDDFLVDVLVPDTIPPRLTAFKVIDTNKIRVGFSEVVHEETALNPLHYFVKELLAYPYKVMAETETSYVLLFEKAFDTGNYTLDTQGLMDLAGNGMTINALHDFYIRPYRVKKGDVVINELMIDPTPVVGLPESEFVELWNTTSNYILLKGWKWKDLQSTAVLSADTLLPNGYLLLCARANTEQWQAFGKTIGLSPWPSLNNDSDHVSLWNENDELIDELAYDISWYKDKIRTNGGYTLELIDPENKCRLIQNWTASTDIRGGTPGTQNAVYKQQLRTGVPKLLKLIWLDDFRLQVDFDRELPYEQLIETTRYQVNNGVGTPAEVSAISPEFKSVRLKFAAALPRGQECTLTVGAMRDCSGNELASTANSAAFFKSEEILPGDILISEVLVNPFPGGVEFVEVYNASGKLLDLSELKLGNSNTQGLPVGLQTVSPDVLHIAPDSYWVLSTSPNDILARYRVENPKQLFKMNSMPVFANQKGSVVLMSADRLIDRFDYREDMHFALFKNVKGVSLERVSFNLTANEPENFRSASQLAGFGTPTAANSQAAQEQPKDRVWLDKRIFSPDGDGYDDVLRMNFSLEMPGWVAHVNIYNEKGVVLRRLLRNANLGLKGTLDWDGRNDAGQTLPLGIYYIRWELFNLKGQRKRFDLTCGLVFRLNSRG